MHSLDIPMDKISYKIVETSRELKEAFTVRRKVFVEEQGISQDIELDSRDDEALHMVVKDGSRIIGTARVLFPAPNLAKIERMAILRPFRRKGVGGGMVSFLNEELKNRQISKAVLHAQHSAVAFYKSCGFVELGTPFYEAGIKHLRMEMGL
jgi:predicted GNAT family N-acyltransferase